MVHTLSLAELYKEKDHLVITACRGYSGRYPENTLVAFEQAVARQADVIAIDLRASAESVPIVLHDSTLDRTSNATGSPNDYAVNELRQINCSHWHGPADTGQRSPLPALPRAPVPSFEELLDKLAHAVCFNIRVHEFDDDFLEQVVELCDAYDLYEQAVLTTRSFAQAERIRALNPYLPLCVLDESRGLEGWRRFGCQAVHLDAAGATRERCRELLDHALHVQVGIVNDCATMAQLISFGIRGIVTAFPDRATQAAEAAGLT